MMSRRNRRGGDTSSRMFCPEGITTVSPSTGGAAPPHVPGLDQRSTYMNVALAATAAAPAPGTRTTTVGGLTWVARRPVTQMTTVALDKLALTAHRMPSTAMVAATLRPVPVIVKDVPPPVVPSAGEMEATNGVVERAYVKFMPPAVSVLPLVLEVLLEVLLLVGVATGRTMTARTASGPMLAPCSTTTTSGAQEGESPPNDCPPTTPCRTSPTRRISATRQRAPPLFTKRILRYRVAPTPVVADDCTAYVDHPWRMFCGMTTSLTHGAPSSPVVPSTTPPRMRLWPSHFCDGDTGCIFTANMSAATDGGKCHSKLHVGWLDDT
mmetsp:Transcript_24742/g.61672  ORF Transcript_24742/g.61672 Transcript_24742/m.61672 type:complete len:324 (+) Transcript_24742:5256-6227(+)